MPLSKKKDKERKRLAKTLRLENEQFQPKQKFMYVEGVLEAVDIPDIDADGNVIPGYE